MNRVPFLAAVLALAPAAACGPPVYSEDDQASLIRDAIQAEYAPVPRPEWFGAFEEIVVENGTAFVQSSFTAEHQELAFPMCVEIAAVAFGPDREPIGVTRVRIYSIQNEEMTVCEVPLRVEPSA